MRLWVESHGLEPDRAVPLASLAFGRVRHEYELSSVATRYQDHCQRHRLRLPEHGKAFTRVDDQVLFATVPSSDSLLRSQRHWSGGLILRQEILI